VVEERARLDEAAGVSLVFSKRRVKTRSEPMEALWISRSPHQSPKNLFGRARSRGVAPDARGRGAARGVVDARARGARRAPRRAPRRVPRGALEAFASRAGARAAASSRRGCRRRPRGEKRTRARVAWTHRVAIPVAARFARGAVGIARGTHREPWEHRHPRNPWTPPARGRRRRPRPRRGRRGGARGARAARGTPCRRRPCRRRKSWRSSSRAPPWPRP